MVPLTQPVPPPKPHPLGEWLFCQEPWFHGALLSPQLVPMHKHIRRFLIQIHLYARMTGVSRAGRCRFWDRGNPIIFIFLPSLGERFFPLFWYVKPSGGKLSEDIPFPTHARFYFPTSREPYFSEPRVSSLFVFIHPRPVQRGLHFSVTQARVRQREVYEKSLGGKPVGPTDRSSSASPPASGRPSCPGPAPSHR